MKENHQSFYAPIYDSLCRLLLPYKDLWEREVLYDYPHGLNAYPLEWMSYLKTLNDEQIMEFDQDKQVHGAPESLVALLQGLSAIENNLPFYYNKTIHPKNYPHEVFFKVTKKKKHEITILAPFIELLKTELHFKSVLDIGGGQGFLSRFLAKFLHLECLCIDRDSDLQKWGKKKLEKDSFWSSMSPIHFINHEFGPKTGMPYSLFKKEQLSVGLHTCGPLAIEHIKAFAGHNAKNPDDQHCALLNFGCCYNRLNSQTDFPLSKYGQKGPIHSLEKFALSLASRSHSAMTDKDFHLKYQVKKYRYAFHLLLQHLLKINDVPTSVGDCTPKQYHQSFGHYAHGRLLYLDLHDLKTGGNGSSLDFFDQFYMSSLTQQKIKEMFLANCLRWKFGRSLEILILLDRALYLEEQDFIVRLEQFFDPVISPRNIALIAFKKH